MKTILWIISTFVLVAEIICFILAPRPVEGDSPEAVLAGMEYVPYIMAAMTLSFVSFFKLLFFGVLVVLQNKITAFKNLFLLMGLNFALPIIIYYTLF